MRRPEITGKKIGMPKDDLACLSFGEMALALGIDEDTLRKLHEEGGDSAPPRVKLGVRRWAYPIYKYREWLERRMQQQVAEPLDLPSRKRAEQQSEINPS